MRQSKSIYQFRMVPPGREALSCLILFAVLSVLLVLAPDVLLVIFAGLLFGVFFGGGGAWLARLIGIGRGWGIGLFVLLIIVALSCSVFGFAPIAAEQFDRLVQEMPAAIEQLRGRIQDYPLGDELVRRVTPGALMPNGGAAATAVTNTFGAIGNFAIMLFIGLYTAIDPATYRRGLISIFAPSSRALAHEVLGKVADTLQNWLMAKLMSMAVVAVLTWLGLWFVGVPLAAIFGLIAGLLAFIPNIGPIMAAVPAILLAFSQSSTMALLVAAVFIVVQSIESYAITPLIQQKQVSLPPALVISMQLLMGALFGILGLALATPMAALGLTAVRETYVKRYLEKEFSEAALPPAPV